MLSRMKEQKGLISVFFSFFLSIILIMSLILNNYYRMQILASRMRSGLRLSSKLALSNFDKKLAREYGLFAIENMDKARDMVNKLWIERFNVSEIRKDSFPLKAQDIELTGVEESGLNKAIIMENQIVQFMEWQKVDLFFEKLNNTFYFFKDTKKFADSMDNKFAYEEQLGVFQKKLNKISDKMSDISALPENWKIEDSGEQFFKGIGSLKDDFISLKEDFYHIDRLYLEARKRTEEEDDGIYADDYDSLRNTFNNIKNNYREKRKSIEEVGKYLNQFTLSLDAISSEAGKLSSLNAELASSIAELPQGALRNSYISDYLNRDLKADSEGINRLSKELKQMKALFLDKSKAWSDININGHKIEDLNFDEWLNEKERRGKQFEEGSWSYDKNLVSGKVLYLSEEAFEVEKNIMLTAPNKRTGLIEFIKAWNKKRKLKAAIKLAEKQGLKNLATLIEKKIGQKAYSKYPENGLFTFKGLGPLFFLKSDKSIFKSIIDNLTSLSEISFVSNIVEKTGRKIDTFLYITNMFSNRVTGKLEKEDTNKGFSLTNYKLKDRPFYGGELEYIIFGKNHLMDNIKSAERSIFALRLMANTAYAFSSTELYNETSALALALSGWTGFGMPLVQSAILSILALGETKLDLDDLIQGNKVPLFKNPTNWRFSVSGIKELAKSVTKDAFDYINTEADSAIGAFSDLIIEKTNNIGKGAKSLVKNALKKPVFSWMLGELTSLGFFNKNKSMERLNKTLSKMSASSDSSAIGKALRTGYSSILASSGQILNLLSQAVEMKKVDGKLTERVSKTISIEIDKIIDNIAKRACSFIDKVENQAKNKANTIINSTHNSLDKNIDQWMLNFKNQLGGGNGASVSQASGLMMGYEDYLHFLLMTSLVALDKDTILTNTCKLIHAECGSIDLTNSACNIILKGKAETYLGVLGTTNIIRSFADRFSKNYTIQEKWVEGYGKEYEK